MYNNLLMKPFLLSIFPSFVQLQQIYFELCIDFLSFYVAIQLFSFYLAKFDPFRLSEIVKYIFVQTKKSILPNLLLIFDKI